VTTQANGNGPCRVGKENLAHPGKTARQGEMYEHYQTPGLAKQGEVSACSETKHALYFSALVVFCCHLSD